MMTNDMTQTQNMVPTPTTNCSNIRPSVTHQVDTMPLFRPVSYDIWAPYPGAPGAWPGLLHYCALAQGHTHSASKQWSSHSAPTTAPTHHNTSIITLNTPLHIHPQKNKLLLQLTTTISRPMKNQHLLKEKPSPTKYLDKLGTILATLRHPWKFFKHEFAGTTHLTTLNFKILFDSWILFFPLHYTGHGHPP